MFHNESWKLIYSGSKGQRSKVKVTMHKNSAGVGLCTLVSAGFFWCVLFYNLAACNVCVCAVDGMLTSVDCDDVTMTYRCSNQRCIPRHLVNNSVNDCLDNSDEGEFSVWTCRSVCEIKIGTVSLPANSRCVGLDFPALCRFPLSLFTSIDY